MMVVDASVAVKSFISEAGEEAAASLLDSREHLVAPARVRLEVAGAIVRLFREGIQAWATMLERHVVHLVPDAELFEKSVQMAFLVRHTLSDCLYLSLAKRLDAQIVIADGRMPGHHKASRTLDTRGGSTNGHGSMRERCSCRVD